MLNWLQPASFGPLFKSGDTILIYAILGITTLVILAINNNIFILTGIVSPDLRILNYTSGVRNKGLLPYLITFGNKGLISILIPQKTVAYLLILIIYAKNKGLTLFDYFSSD
jgi:hypothetical protein